MAGGENVEIYFNTGVDRLHWYTSIGNPEGKPGFKGCGAGSGKQYRIAGAADPGVPSGTGLYI